MSDAYSNDLGPPHDPREHLPGWTLEQMAEEILPPEEHRAALRHVAACVRCAAELEGYRALFAALAGLPRFEPSVGFSDAVMARTRVAPAPGPVTTWLRQFTPKSRRGWALLSAAVVAPALPILGVAVWLLTHPLLGASTVWRWLLMQGRSAAQTAGTLLVRWADDVGLAQLAVTAYRAAQDVPMEAIAALIAVLAVAIPLSVWALVRLVHTPTRHADYANRTV